MIALCTCLAAGLFPAGAGAQLPPLFDRDSHFVQLDRRAAVPDRVRTICRSSHPMDYAALIKEEDALVDSVERHNASATAWVGLACQRALLFAMGAPGREGRMMLPGASWVSAAIDEAGEALWRDPSDERAARLLAAIGFELVPARIPAGEERSGDPLTPRPDAPPAIVPRLANQLYRAVQLGVHDPAVLRACTSLMLDAGNTATAHDCSMRALALGSDSTWHLLRVTWLATVHDDTATAKLAFATALRSAHDADSRAEVGWHFEDPCRPHLACTPIGFLAFNLPSADKISWLQMPDSAAALWVTTSLDQAARGDTTPYWRGERGSWTQSEPPLRASRDWSVLVRHLVAHFTSVSYAGATFRPCLVVILPEPPCWATLNPYGSPPVEVVAQVDHLWDPATGIPTDLVPYTIIANDLATHDGPGGPVATVDVLFSRWGDRGTRDTAMRLSLQLANGSAKHRAFTGYIVVPTAGGLNGWSLMMTQAELRSGGVYQDAKPALDSGALALSDLVLGASSQGLAWKPGGQEIVLAPQGTVLRSEPVELYYQVKSKADIASARTTIAVYPEGSDSTAPAMHLAFDGPIHRGLNEVERGLVVSRLASGRYLFEVEVADPARQVTSRRSVLMYVK